ncbi:hypothetical protein ABH926_003223 [Catenulispora sp. GP43]
MSSVDEAMRHVFPRMRVASGPDCFSAARYA